MGFNLQEVQKLSLPSEQTLAAGPVLESLMSMRNLPAASALQGGSTGGSARGQPLKRVQEGLEEESSEEEDDRSSSKLSPVPSTTNPRGSQASTSKVAFSSNPYLAKRLQQSGNPSGGAGVDRPGTIKAVGGLSTNASAKPASTFLRSSRTLQHRQALTTGSSADSATSQSSGPKFGQVARIGAYGVAAAPPPGLQSGSHTRPQRPSSGRIQKKVSSNGRNGSRPSSRGQASGFTVATGSTAKLQQLARSRNKR